VSLFLSFFFCFFSLIPSQSNYPNQIIHPTSSIIIHHHPSSFVIIHHLYRELLLEHGADVNSVSRSGRTPLIAAAFGGHSDLVKLFIRHNAKLDVQDKRHQMTALHHAMNEIRHDHDAEHEACIRALIDAGADMHLVASNGNTVEHIADLKKLYHGDLHRHIVHRKKNSKKATEGGEAKPPPRDDINTEL
jgi:ankyrin repeat protein